MPKIKRARPSSTIKASGYNPDLCRKRIIEACGSGSLKRGTCCCPAHSDTYPSLSVNVQAGKLLVKCHAGCSQEDVISALKLRGLWPETSPRKTVYDYTDEKGRLVYQVIRIDLPDGNKRISQRSASGGNLAGVQRYLYRLPDILRASRVPIHIAEGEKCVEALRTLNVIATCNSGGSNSWRSEFAHYLSNRDVVIHEDNDQQGRKFVETVCKSLVGVARSIKVITYRDKREKYDVADWVAEGGTTKRLIEMVAAAPDWQRIQPNEVGDVANLANSANLLWMSEVKAEKVRWLIKNWIPYGKVTLIDGNPGEGKSTLAVYIAAQLSRGRSIVSGAPSRRLSPKRTLFITLEDDAADTIKPRLEAAGGNPELVGVLPTVTPDGSNIPRPFSLPEDLQILERLILEQRISLVVIDPLMAHLNGKVDSHKDQHIRGALTPLAQVAQKTGAAIVVVRHLNKQQGGSAIQRGSGSIGIAGAARSVLLFAKDPDDEDRRVLAPVKMNLCKMPTPLRFRFIAVKDDAPTQVKWEGYSNYSANQLLQNPDERASALKTAMSLLKTILANGPRPSADVSLAVGKEGISKRTFDRARKELGVRWKVKNGKRMMFLAEAEK